MSKSIPASATATKSMFSTAPSKEEDTSFSFSAPKSEVAKWRFYAKFTGMKLRDLGNTALEEYFENHPLPKEQQEVFEKLLKEQLQNI